jgi:hypothetical protein
MYPNCIETWLFNDENEFNDFNISERIKIINKKLIFDIIKVLIKYN